MVQAEAMLDTTVFFGLTSDDMFSYLESTNSQQNVTLRHLIANKPFQVSHTSESEDKRRGCVFFTFCM